MRPLPMKPSRVFTGGQINLKIDPELKHQIEYLKTLGVDTSELMREAVRDTVQEAINQFDDDQAS